MFVGSFTKDICVYFDKNYVIALSKFERPHMLCAALSKFERQCIFMCSTFKI